MNTALEGGGGQRHAPAALYPRERPGTHCTGGWVGARREFTFTLVQALRLCTGRTAHRESRGIALRFHDHGTRRGEGSASCPRPLFTPGKSPVPIVQEAGSGQVRKISIPGPSPPPQKKRITKLFRIPVIQEDFLTYVLMWWWLSKYSEWISLYLIANPAYIYILQHREFERLCTTEVTARSLVFVIHLKCRIL
jgi:hypothetical protein